MRRAIALLAILAAFTYAAAANAGQGVQTPCPISGPVVDCQAITVGDLDTATVTMTITPHLTTAFAIGVWGSNEVAAPVQINYHVTCEHPGNNRSGSIQLLAGRFVSDAAYIWVGSPTIAGPFYGWDTCGATVTVIQPGNGLADHSIVGWLASHR